MGLKRKVLILFLFISMLFQFFPCFVSAQAPIQKEVERATLQVLLDFSYTGEVVLKVEKLNPAYSEPEEMARLLSHWFSKIMYTLSSSTSRMFLLYQVLSVFESELKPKDNVLSKTQIDDVVKVVSNIEREKITSSISLYLQELQNAKRGLISYFQGDLTEQQVVFSWTIILQYVSQNYSSKDISFVCHIMDETIKVYSGGADPDAVENTVIIPNDAFFKAKKRN